MICIYCGSETEVTNSRPKAWSPSVWRRRVCKVCVAQFTTLELPDYAKALLVASPGQKRLEPFSRDKLFLSLYKSLGHRPDVLNSATALSTTIIGRLMNKKHIINGAVETKSIAKVSFEVLKRFDPAGAHTYKAYHLTSLK